MRLWIGAGLIGAGLIIAGCLVPSVNLDGKACDDGHPCIDGYVCDFNGSCVTPAEFSAEDAGAPEDGG